MNAVISIHDGKDLASLNSELQMRHLIRYTPAAVAMFDLDMRYIMTSERWLEDYHLQGREIIGKSHHEIFPETMKMPQWQEYHRRAQDGEVLSMEEDCWLRADGRAEWVKWVLHPWYDAEGKIGGFGMFTEVITRRKHAEDALKESEARYERAVRASSAGIWDWNIQTGGVYWSPRFRKIFGITDELFLPSFHEFEARIHPEDRPRVLQALEAHLARRSPYNVEYRVRHKDGHYVWIHSRGEAKWDENGAPVRMAGAIEDISRRKKAEADVRESEEVFRNAMDHAPIGIGLVSPGGKWLKVNQALCDIIGYTLDEMLQIDFQTITHPDDLAKDMEHVEQMLQRKIPTYAMEKRYRHKNGNFIWIMLNVSLIWNTDGTPKYFISQIQNINERKQQEALNEGLIAKLTDSNAKLERFAYVSSHDMQEPLRMMANFSGLLANEYGNRLDATAIEYLSIIMDSSKRMQLLVNDLLEYSRVGNASLRQEEFDADKELAFVIKELTVSIHSHHANVTYDMLPNLKGNRLQFYRLLQNLIANAIKYHATDAGAKVHVFVEDKGGCWKFAVRDNGIGIKPEYLEKIFEPFHRLHSWHEYPGTGLGLAICRKIVELHQGRLWVESQPGKGSTFCFTWPKIINPQTAGAIS